MRPARVRPWIAGALFYLALVVTLTWPLAARLPRVVVHDLGDPLENTWILWWNAHTLPLTERWWNAPIFWPAPAALGLSEHLLGFSLVTTPLQWLGASPTTAYNICFLLSFPLCALAAHALVFAITRRHDAGIVAGLIFGFNPYRVAQAAHLQVLASWWLPIALLALHQYVQRRERRWLSLFAVAWLLQSLSNGYLLLFFPVLIVLWICWFVRDGQTLVEILVTWLLASVPLVPFVWRYRQIHAMFNLRREFAEIAAFGGDVASFLDTAPGLMTFSKFGAFHKLEGELFPGFTGAVLVAVAIAAYRWNAPRTRS